MTSPLGFRVGSLIRIWYRRTWCRCDVDNFLFCQFCTGMHLFNKNVIEPAVCVPREPKVELSADLTLHCDLQNVVSPQTMTMTTTTTYVMNAQARLIKSNESKTTKTLSRQCVKCLQELNYCYQRAIISGLWASFADELWT